MPQKKLQSRPRKAGLVVLPLGRAGDGGFTWPGEGSGIRVSLQRLWFSLLNPELLNPKWFSWQDTKLWDKTSLKRVVMGHRHWACNIRPQEMTLQRSPVERIKITKCALALPPERLSYLELGRQRESNETNEREPTEEVCLPCAYFLLCGVSRSCDL